MDETYYAGAYWDRRQESAEACAHRAETFFRLLAQSHETYAHWYEKAASAKKGRLRGFEPTREAFTRFFGQAAYQNGSDGFYFGAWTGPVEEGQGGAVTLFCGAHENHSSNHVLLYLPDESPGHEHLLLPSVLASVMRALVMAWEPDWAVITSGDFRDALSEQGAAGTFVGWLTYLARHRGEVPELPAPVSTHPVEDKGTLILLGPDRLTPSNPAQVALAQWVQSQLESKGLLKRVVEPRALHAE